MTKKTITVAQLKKYLVEDNDWTEEEFEQLTGYHFRLINEDGTTLLTASEWEMTAAEF